MKTIDEMRVCQFFADLNGEALMNRFEKVQSNDPFIVFSNTNNSDFVLAYLGKLFGAVSRATPYTDMEMKMNMALRRVQEYDWNSPVIWDLSGWYNPRTRSQFEVYLKGLNDWTAAEASRRIVPKGYLVVLNSMAMHRMEDDSKKILYAPVVRLDKFAEFRKRVIFNGEINWSEYVTYWINEDFLRKSKEEGRHQVLLMWNRLIYPELKLKNFRIEIVSNETINGLIHVPQSAKVTSIVQLEEEASSLVKEVYNAELVKHKGSIMLNMARMTTDYISAHIPVVSTEEASSVDESVAVQAAEEDDDLLVEEEVEDVTPMRVGGIIEQLENTPQSAYEPLTVERLSSIIDHLSMSEPPQQRVTRRRPRGARTQEEQALYLRELANQINPVIPGPVINVQQSDEAARRFAREYPFTPDEAFAISETEEERHTRHQAVAEAFRQPGLYSIAIDPYDAVVPILEEQRQDDLEHEARALQHTIEPNENGNNNTNSNSTQVGDNQGSDVLGGDSVEYEEERDLL